MAAVYREAELYVALDKALKWAVASEHIPESLGEVGRQLYDQKMRELISKNWTDEAAASVLVGKIMGSTDWYRSYDNKYTFMLRDVTFVGHCFFSGAASGQKNPSATFAHVKLVAVDASRIDAKPAPAAESNPQAQVQRNAATADGALCFGGVESAARAEADEDDALFDDDEVDGAEKPAKAGADEDEDDALFDDDEEDGAEKPAKRQREDARDELLTAEDDDEEELVETCDNIVIAQFNKVKRSGDKWKLTLIGGIAKLAGREYAFRKAETELTY